MEWGTTFYSNSNYCHICKNLYVLYFKEKGKYHFEVEEDSVNNILNFHVDIY